MIAHLDDFCLWVYVLVDDMCQALERHLRRPGPKPACSDSELIAICLIGECLGGMWKQSYAIICRHIGISFPSCRSRAASIGDDVT